MDSRRNYGAIIAALVAALIVLFIFIVLQLTGVIDLRGKSNQNNSQDSTTEVVYTADMLKGAYKFVTEERTDDLGNKYKASYSLTLYANGLFEYRMSTMAPFGYIGSYTIKGNKITLNYLFGTTSSYGIHVLEESKTKELIINSDGTLTDAHQSIEGLDFESVILTLDSSTAVDDDALLTKLYETAISNKMNK